MSPRLAFRPFSWAMLLLAVSCAGTASRPNELDPGTLDGVKAATVFVRTQGDVSGSGFLFLKRGDVGYVMTCEHVLKYAASINVVFSSGTPAERSLPGRIVSTDPRRDLACIEVRAAGLPPPLEIAAGTELKETQAVFVAGFPFGRMLGLGTKNPELSVGLATITSVRHQPVERAASILLNGELNPGISGGPVITREGRVVGVTREKVENTRVGFASSAEQISDFLRGEVKNSKILPWHSTAATAKLKADLELVNPVGALKAAGIAHVPESQVTGEPGPDAKGEWDRIHPSMTSVTLRIEGDRANEFFEIARSAGAPKSAIHVFQAWYDDAAGTRHWTEPKAFDVTFAEAATPTASPSPAPSPSPDPAHVAMSVPEQLPIVATLPLNSVVPQLVLSPDRDALYALDLSEGMVYQLDPATLAISRKTEVVENAVAMAMAPNGAKLYVAAEKRGSKGKEPRTTGLIQVISTSTWKAEDPFEIPEWPHQIEATDRGLLAVSIVGQTEGLLLVNESTRADPERVRGVNGRSFIRITPDGARVYAGDRNIAPSDFRCVILRKDRDGYPCYDSPYHGEQPTGGCFEITPDGKYILGGAGGVFRLGKTRDADLKFVSKIDRFVAAGLAADSPLVFTAGDKGFVKIYDAKDFELKRSIPVDLLCSKLVIDTKRMRLHAVVSKLPESDFSWQLQYPAGVGRIVSFSLSGK